MGPRLVKDPGVAVAKRGGFYRHSFQVVTKLEAELILPVYSTCVSRNHGSLTNRMVVEQRVRMVHLELLRCGYVSKQGLGPARKRGGVPFGVGSCTQWFQRTQLTYLEACLLKVSSSDSKTKLPNFARLVAASPLAETPQNFRAVKGVCFQLRQKAGGFLLDGSGFFGCVSAFFDGKEHSVRFLLSGLGRRDLTKRREALGMTGCRVLLKQKLSHHRRNMLARFRFCLSLFLCVYVSLCVCACFLFVFFCLLFFLFSFFSFSDWFI